MLYPNLNYMLRIDQLPVAICEFEIWKLIRKHHHEDGGNNGRVNAVQSWQRQLATERRHSY
jgi:hypothetical protein